MPSLTLCQNFTVSELIKINNYDLDKFDTYVVQKGYRYYHNEDTDFASIRSYSFSTNGNIIAYISTFKFKKDNQIMVSYQIFNSRNYLLLKNEIKKLGFKYTNSKTNKETTFLYYSKENIEVSIASSTKESPDNSSKTISHEISVTKYY